jgi:G6PDH family F420-dependent oxidoreductase
MLARVFAGVRRFNQQSSDICEGTSVPNFGYTLMTEQSGPRELVRYAAAAEEAGFDFEVSSDHFFPWLTEMGHSPYAWAMLGAVAQATTRVELMTYVTCPTIRYHPAIIAQKAATLGLLSDNRFTLGLGSGENLNEHVVGAPWPVARVRQEMLVEALHIIRALHSGDQISWVGDHFSVESAKIWDLPEEPIHIGIAVSGPSSIEQFAPLADHMIAVEPQPELVQGWDTARSEAGLAANRKIGQIPICWGPDKDAAVKRAHELFRWFGGTWHVNADLPTPVAFDAASKFVTPDDVADAVACGPDLDELAESVKPFLDAGFTDVAIVQIGDESQDRFLAEIAPALLTKLRAL